MTFIITLISLIIERFFHWNHLRHWRWFDAYQRKITQPIANMSSYLLIAIITIPLMLIVGLTNNLLDGALFGILQLIFGVVILLYCMGPDNLWLQSFGALNTLHKEDPSIVVEHVQKSFGIPLPDHSQGFHQALTSAIFVEANQRIFAVIFWFVVLGPVGAVMYRAIALCTLRTDLGLTSAALQLQALLDWIPVRILTFIFALGGHFKDVISFWKKDVLKGPATNAQLISECGIAALDVRNGNQLPEDGEAEKEALELLDRSFVIFLVILAVFVIMLR